MRNFKEYVACKLNTYGRKFDTSDLAPDFIKYFESGERVKVEWTYNNYKEVLTGTIGVTTGWKPVFLLMRTKRSIGSPYIIYTKDCRVIAVKKSNKYVEVIWHIMLSMQLQKK